MTSSSTAFRSWMRRVDQLLVDSLGLDSQDLVDRCWRDMFDDGVSPREAASDIINNPYDFI